MKCRQPSIKAIWTEAVAQRVALTCASSRYAADLWQAGDWNGYQSVRVQLVNASRMGVKLQLRHLQYFHFVQAHLQPLQSAWVSDRDAFLATASPAQVRSIFIQCPLRFTVDDCPVFL